MHVSGKVGTRGACSLSDFLNSSQPYINYEEELLAEEGERCRGAGNSEYDWTQKKDNDRRKKDKSQIGISLMVE